MKDLLRRELNPGDILCYCIGKIGKYESSVYTGQTTKGGQLRCVHPQVSRYPQEVFIITEMELVSRIYMKEIRFKRREGEDGIIRTYHDRAHNLGGKTDGTYKGLIMNYSEQAIRESRFIKGELFDNMTEDIEAQVDILEAEYAENNESFPRW